MPLAVIALIVVADRITKVEIRAAFNDFDSVSIIPGWLRIVHAENPGAAFGFLAEGNPLLRSAVLIGVSSVVLMLVGYALWGRSKSFTSPLIRIGLSLIMGGAASNLFDRIFRGAVTDFIEVYHGGWSFPAFNVADSAITIGAALLLLDMLWSPNRSSCTQN